MPWAPGSRIQAPWDSTQVSVIQAVKYYSSEMVKGALMLGFIDPFIQQAFIEIYHVPGP